MEVFPKINFLFPSAEMALNSIWNRIGIHALLSSNTDLECLWLTHILILTTQNRVIYHLQSQSHHQHYHYLCIMVNAMRVAGNIIGAKLYEKCFITTRCTFAVTNEWERGWQTDNQTRLRVLCVSVYRHSHTHTHTNARAPIPAQKSGPFAIVLVMHKQKEEKVEQELVVGCPAWGGGI